jgi:hypothetical protein
MPYSRRAFFKLGVFSTLVLATSGIVYRRLHEPAAPAAFALDPEANAALRAISAVMLAGVIDKNSSAALDAAVASTLKAISGLPLTTQNEISDLFGLLVLSVTRRMLVGLSAPWTKATPDEIASFLQGWRMHRIGMLQAAYFALHDLILGAWYGEPANWAAIGYPGPMKELS